MVLVDALSEGLRAAETPEEWAHQKIILDGDLTETLKPGFPSWIGVHPAPSTDFNCQVRILR
jgi:hypothetical protein